MVVISLVLLLKLTLTAKGYDVVFDRELEIVPVHARQLGFEHNLIFVLVDVDARIPGAPADSFLPEPSGKVSGEKAVHLFLQTA
jgi:hypothetical protein